MDPEGINGSSLRALGVDECVRPYLRWIERLPSKQQVGRSSRPGRCFSLREKQNNRAIENRAMD